MSLSLLWNHSNCLGGQMLVAFIGNPCPQFYIPWNVYTSICLIFIKLILIILPTKSRLCETGKFLLPTNIDPTKKKIPQYSVYL